MLESYGKEDTYRHNFTKVSKRLCDMFNSALMPKEVALEGNFNNNDKYITETDTLDRATRNLEALQKAKSRGRTLTKMTINIIIHDSGA